MAWFRCANCQRTREFKGKMEYELKGNMCGGCGKTGLWKTYTGPIADIILREEDQQYEILRNERARIILGLQTAKAAHDERKVKYELRKTLDRESSRRSWRRWTSAAT